MNSYLFASESVSEGHPDKLADQVSERISDAILGQGPTVRVAALLNKIFHKRRSS
tara:strand:+ start:597 stop:761 length:165 start_codon:yes stop_codon:yes gene_type:complete